MNKERVSNFPESYKSRGYVTSITAGLWFFYIGLFFQPLLLVGLVILLFSGLRHFRDSRIRIKTLEEILSRINNESNE